ncbi:MAG: iron-containing alcohol dehydrogenase, partial [Rhodospirillales bacterium]|nr:iron-containing alcohol dehydrogenase [Rhodospirillales bacterium]
MAHIPGFPSVHFGFEAVKELSGELKNRGVDRPLVITDQGLVKHGVCQQLLDALPSDIAVSVFDQIPENPTIAGVEGALAVYQENNCNGIIGLGGGSVLDSGKALRVATNQNMAVIEYLNDLSKVTADVAPYITIPTTAGTGAEITFGGGIHPETNAPVISIRSIHVQPDLAICDPDFTMTLPPLLTAATGMDALTHCVEGFLSNNANPP